MKTFVASDDIAAIYHVYQSIDHTNSSWEIKPLSDKLVMPNITFVMC